MYIRVIRQNTKPGSMQTISDAAQSQMPDVSGIPGVVAYYVVDLGADKYATVGVFEDKAAADKWVETARQHVRRHKIDQHLESGPGAIVGFGGRVIYHRTKQATS